MAATRSQRGSCEGCGETGGGVQDATIEGAILSLCRTCYRRLILGGTTLDELGIDVTDRDYVPGVEIVDEEIGVTVGSDLLKELPSTTTAR